MWAAKHLYRVSLLFLLLVVRLGGADNPEGGAVQEDQQLNEVSFGHWYSGRTKYSAFVSKLSKLSEKYLSLQKTQKAAVFFSRKIFGGTMI